MKKILVIDDAEFILESTSTLLTFEGYEVVTAEDGVQGVEAAFKHHPDLILCDINMPNKDGYEVVEDIRQSEELNTVPFIFLTAFTEKQNMRQGMEKGADDFLVKPYTREELLAAINAQWNKKEVVEQRIQSRVEEVGKNLNYALPHEFRTVINQVKGSAKIMAVNGTETSVEEINELTDDILESCDRLLKITENFLIYVRIESYVGNPEKRRTLRQMQTDEPGALLYDLVSNSAMNQDRMEDLKLGEIVDSILIEISTESFHKVIDELVDNALKFSEKGTPIEVETWLDGGYLYFKIKDNGRGMTPEQIKNIGAYMQFERTIYEQQGVGLGLVISKRLVELHDGEFSIKSVEGEFTEITFSLPYRKLS